MLTVEISKSITSGFGCRGSLKRERRKSPEEIRFDERLAIPE